MNAHHSMGRTMTEQRVVCVGQLPPVSNAQRISSPVSRAEAETQHNTPFPPLEDCCYVIKPCRSMPLQALGAGLWEGSPLSLLFYVCAIAQRHAPLLFFWQPRFSKNQKSGCNRVTVCWMRRRRTTANHLNKDCIFSRKLTYAVSFGWAANSPMTALVPVTCQLTGSNPIFTRQTAPRNTDSARPHAATAGDERH